MPVINQTNMIYCLKFMLLKNTSRKRRKKYWFILIFNVKRVNTHSQSGTDICKSGLIDKVQDINCKINRNTSKVNARQEAT